MNRRLRDRLALAEARVPRPVEPGPFAELSDETLSRLDRLLRAAEADPDLRARIAAVRAGGGSWERVADEVILP